MFCGGVFVVCCMRSMASMVNHVAVCAFSCKLHLSVGEVARVTVGYVFWLLCVWCERLFLCFVLLHFVASFVDVVIHIGFVQIVLCLFGIVVCSVVGILLLVLLVLFGVLESMLCECMGVVVLVI